MAQPTADLGMASLEKATNNLDIQRPDAQRSDSFLSNTPAANARHNEEKKVDKDGKTEEKVDPNHEEFQYLNLIRDILRDGEHRPDR